MIALSCVALLLIGLSGLFAALEAALFALPQAEIAELATKPRSPAALPAIAADPMNYVTGAGLLRIASQTIAAVLITVVCVVEIPSAWIACVVAVLVMVVVSLAFVGVSPVIMGRNNSDVVLRLGSGLLRTGCWFLKPVLGRLGKRRQGLFDEEDHERSILNLIDRANEQSVVEDEERKYMHSIVEFSDTIARSISVPRTDMVTVDRDASVDSAVATFLANGVSRLPVFGDDVDDVVGVIYLRDVTRVLYHGGEATTKPGGIMPLVRPPQLVPEMLPASQLLQTMRANANHMAILIDEYGGISGLVTMEDLLEELVGEISDEYDSDAQDITQIAPLTYRVDARVELDEIADLFDVEFDEDDVDTVGGLLVKGLGHLPKRGERITISGVQLEADNVEARNERVRTVIASASDELKAIYAAKEEMVKDHE